MMQIEHWKKALFLVQTIIERVKEQLFSTLRSTTQSKLSTITYRKRSILFYDLGYHSFQVTHDISERINQVIYNDELLWWSRSRKEWYPPGGYYPGASYGLQQQAALAHGHPQAAGMTPGLAQHPGLAPGHGQQTTVPSYGTPVSSHSYTGYTGMAPGQSIYTTTGYSIPQGYPSAMNGSAGLTSMGAFYSTPHMSALPYSTLQPIPQATPSIPSVASLPSVPAVPHIPSIQQTQSGYPASHRQHQLSSAYLSEQAAKQAGYPIGSNPMMHPGMSSASVPGMPWIPSRWCSPRNGLSQPVVNERLRRNAWCQSGTSYRPAIWTKILNMLTLVKDYCNYKCKSNAQFI
ncbi:unnamed protein product [Mytilus edulis]|uniref:Uncharacterized protein n=1 Tax=Mytilus edulis TaxID=6550 RepID=A0A8S3S4F9_MYTED|nr:unnamed protein product [Mytilus edulis]